MKKVLLIGAGSAGKKVLQEIKKTSEINPVGFLDIDKTKFGKIIDGVIVLGNYENIEEFSKNLEIDEIWITSTQISLEEVLKIKDKIKNLNVKIEQLPDMEDMNLSEPFFKQLKEQNIPLAVPNLQVSEIVANLKECIESGWVSTGGRFISEFENKIAKYLGMKEAVGVQSGTAGLHTALRVLGVESGDEVFAPTLTFIAAVNPIAYQGAKPIFIGCDDTLCIDPIKLKEFCEKNCEMKAGNLYNKKSGNYIKAIVVVHVFGNMADMEKIIEIANKYNLKVLEDATEALGTFYTKGKYNGKFAGTMGDIGVYSFNANKIITTGGGGMVVSNNKKYLDEIRFLSTQAKTDQLYYIHDQIGYNYRMLNLQAALGTEQIDALEKFIETKTKNYDKYKKAIKKIDGLKLVDFNSDIRSNFWFYSVVVDKEKYGLDKDELLKKLVEVGIQTRPIWGLIHQQKPYLQNEVYGDEKALWYYDRILNIPCSTNLTEEDAEIVISYLEKFKK
ncbi:MAG: LegC family aminotransferase [Fusobacteriaceae bacterium]